MSTTNTSTDWKAQREYAWSYFELHAGQRMTTFNFFVVIAALLTTALAGTFDPAHAAPRVGVCMGVFLVLISFIFWKLDQRVRHLIRHGEDTLKMLETHLHAGASKGNAGLFNEEDESTRQARTAGGGNPLARHLSYSECFGLVYAAFAVVGVLGAVASIG